MFPKLDVFDDFHLHGASAPEWNQLYQQLSPGAMRSSLTEVTAGSVHVFRKWMSERVVQRGALPAGKICFAVPAAGSDGTPRMQGHEMGAGNLLVLRGGDDFTLHRPKGMELLAVTFDAEVFSRWMDERAWLRETRNTLRQGVATAPSHLVDHLRGTLLAQAAPAPSHATAAAVFEALGNVFAAASGATQAFGSASASYIVAECHRIVENTSGEVPSIEALCQRLRTSRRTLQNSFRQVADMTPVHYLRSVRLNAVRHELLTTPRTAKSTSQAATDHGFDHISHFSERYKSLFGELPSQTVRRAR